MLNWVVVGAGLTGATVARRLADIGKGPILVVERRDHIAGNAFDFRNQYGTLVHKYGPHIFHTNSDRIWKFLSKFTEWTSYEHRVLANVDGVLVPVPFNYTSMRLTLGSRRAERIISELNSMYGEGQKVPVYRLLENENFDIIYLGRFVYDSIFLNYTIKQWGMRPEELDTSVTARVPVRLSHDDRYFEDKYQAMPQHGYTAMIERMLDHPDIEVLTSTSFSQISEIHNGSKVVFTGAIDEYFKYSYGYLDYRSVDFIWSASDSMVQPVATVNFPNAPAITRTTEFFHLTGKTAGPSTLVTERPLPHTPGITEPYYPIPLPEPPKGLKVYKDAATALRGRVWFAGRLGDYAYYNMDQAVGRGLALVEKELSIAA